MKSLTDYRSEAIKALESVDPSLVSDAEIKRQIEYMLSTDRDQLERVAIYHVGKATEALTEPYRAFHANRVVSVNAEIGHLGNLIDDLEGAP